MLKIWIATAADTDEDGSWLQVVTYDPADVIRFLLNHPYSHVSEWELLDRSLGLEPEQVGP